MTKLYAAFDETNIGPTSPKDLKIGPISVVLFSLSEKLVGLKDIWEFSAICCIWFL